MRNQESHPELIRASLMTRPDSEEINGGRTTEEVRELVKESILDLLDNNGIQVEDVLLSGYGGESAESEEYIGPEKKVQTEDSNSYGTDKQSYDKRVRELLSDLADAEDDEDYDKVDEISEILRTLQKPDELDDEVTSYFFNTVGGLNSEDGLHDDSSPVSYATETLPDPGTIGIYDRNKLVELAKEDEEKNAMSTYKPDRDSALKPNASTILQLSPDDVESAKIGEFYIHGK